jgi:hypothetical protein
MEEVDMTYCNLAAADPTVVQATGRDAGTRDEQLRALMAIHGGIGTYDIDSYDIGAWGRGPVATVGCAD